MNYPHTSAESASSAFKISTLSRTSSLPHEEQSLHRTTTHAQRAKVRSPRQTLTSQGGRVRSLRLPALIYAQHLSPQHIRHAQAYLSGGSKRVFKRGLVGEGLGVGAGGNSFIGLPYTH